MLAEALRSATLRFTSLHLHLKEFVLNYALPSEQLCDHMKQNRHLLPSLMLMMTSTNTASIGLTVHTEAEDEAEDEASVHITEGGEETHTEEVNVMEETREQDFSRRDAMSATSQAAGLLSILLRREGRHTRSSVNILHIHWRKRPPQNITTASSPNMKELKKLTILRPNFIPNSSCQ